MAITRNKKFDPNEIDFTGEYYDQLRNRYPEQTAVADAVQNRNFYKRTGDAPTEEEIAETPAPEPRQTEVTQQGRVYKIKRGDTLSAIGKHFGVDWREIAKANGISNPNMIVAGKDLIIPGQGETSSSTSSNKSVRPVTPAKANTETEPIHTEAQPTSTGTNQSKNNVNLGGNVNLLKARRTVMRPTPQGMRPVTISEEEYNKNTNANTMRNIGRALEEGIYNKPNTAQGSSSKSYDRADVNRTYNRYPYSTQTKQSTSRPNNSNERTNSKPATQKRASTSAATNKPKTQANIASRLTDIQLRDALNHPSKYGLHINEVNAEYKRRHRNYQYTNL